jgi:glutamine cyclotransferase
LRTLFCLFLLLTTGHALAVDQYRYRVIDRQPQSRSLFTQGLEIRGDDLYLSSGHYGRSKLLRFDLQTGELELQRHLAANHFAEGITLLGERVFQLTWRSRLMLVYDSETLQPVTRHELPGEGWGLTNDGHRLIYSDGSASLHFVDPDSGRREHSITVTENGRPLGRLNELEWIDGAIWANVWLTNRIVIIDPATGAVTGNIDLSGLLSTADRRNGTDVLNGIAYDRQRKALWLTGKHWPYRFHVELLPIDAPPAGDSR